MIRATQKALLRKELKCVIQFHFNYYFCPDCSLLKKQTILMILTVHLCRFENLSICSYSYENVLPIVIQP